MKTLPLLRCGIIVAICWLITWNAQPTAAGEAGVRIRFGLKDEEPKEWNGSVSVKPGKVAAISGWRFEQDDQAHGTESWTASTRGAVDTRTNAAKAAAKAK